MKIKNNSAIALILSVGVLAILALITVGFSGFTKLELQATENQINLLKASYIAQAGIAQVIEDIKYDSSFGAVSEPYDSALDPWYYQGNANYDGSIIDLASAASPSYGGNISYAGGYYRLKVIDCGGLININCPLPDSDAKNDLKDILHELGLTSTQAQNLVSFRQSLPGKVFTTKEEIKLVSGIGQTEYESIKDFITLWGDNDTDSSISTHTKKSFVNVNTAPVQVLRAIFRPMMNSNTQADNLASAIKARRGTNPFDGLNPTSDVANFLDARGEFERYIEYAYSTGTISNTNRDAVLSQSDPNSYTPAPSDPNSFFSSNIDSTDSAIIGFDANGYYEIEVIGTYRGAKKRIKQVISVFRKINQTTKDEFSANQGWDYSVSPALPLSNRISWKDTCPIDFTVLKQYKYNDDSGDNPNHDDYIMNSLKLGFWDNFQEDYSSTSSSPVSGVLGPWQEINETFTINDGGDGKLKTFVAGAIVAGQDYFPKVTLDKDICIVDDFAMIVHEQDEDNLTNPKYPIDRPNLPWPAVPLEWAWIGAPDPDPSNCPDIGKNVRAADGTEIKDSEGNPTLIDVQYVKDHMRSPLIHEQYLNTFHVRFGNIMDTTIGKEMMSAIFCNNVQDKDIYFNNIADKVTVYQNWVNYDGTGYIYFTPSPDYTYPDWQAAYQTCMKPQAVISGSNVMVSCNEYYGEGVIPFFADDSTEYFPIAGNIYQDEKTFHLKGIGQWHTRGEVYFNTAASTSFITTHQIMVWKDRYFQFAGMGNFPDLDYFRIVPSQGVYTSAMLVPASSGTIEWGTIQAHVTLPGTADSVRETVYLATADTAPTTAPSASYIPPVILPSGGPVVSTNSQSICYQAYLFSDFGDADINNIDFEQAPVVEDVTITYLPKTQIVYYNAM